MKAYCSFCGKVKEGCVKWIQRMTVINDPPDCDVCKVIGGTYICGQCLKDMRELYNGSEGV